MFPFLYYFFINSPTFLLCFVCKLTCIKFIQLFKKNKKTQCNSKKRKRFPTNVLVLPHKQTSLQNNTVMVLQQPHVAHIGVICFSVAQPVLTKPNTARKELAGMSDKHWPFPCRSREIWRGKHWKGCGDAMAVGLCTCPAVCAACVTRLLLTPAHLCLVDGWTQTGCSAMCADRITLRAYIIHHMRHMLGRFLCLGSLPVHSTHIQRSGHRRTRT